MLFNLFGVVWMAFVFSPMLHVIDVIVPGEIDHRTDIAAHLAMFHTVFNVINTAICLGFVPQFEKLVRRAVKDIPQRDGDGYRLSYMRGGLQDTVELNVVTAHNELSKMAGHVQSLFAYFFELLRNPSKEIRKASSRYEKLLELVQIMHEEITGFLVECSREAVSEQTATNINAMARISAELESIADTSGKLIRIANKRIVKGIKISSSHIEKIEPYANVVGDFLAFNAHHLEGNLTPEQYQRAQEMEETINGYQKRYKKATQKRIKTGSPVKAELLYLDILRHIEHVGDFSLNISESLVQMR